MFPVENIRRRKIKGSTLKRIVCHSKQFVLLLCSNFLFVLTSLSIFNMFRKFVFRCLKFRFLYSIDLYTLLLSVVFRILVRQKGNLELRVKEHTKGIPKRNVSKSVVLDHFWCANHLFLYDRVEVLSCPQFSSDFHFFLTLHVFLHNLIILLTTLFLPFLRFLNLYF